MAWRSESAVCRGRAWSNQPPALQFLDRRAFFHYDRAMFPACTMNVSFAYRGRAAGPGALRMR
jgi:hypothetical protein